MPAPGAQHSSIANPFEEAKPRISEFTAAEIATLQARLEKQLGPEYLSARSGPSGQKVHYIAAEKCIALANEVFGFNGWSSSIQNIQVDFVDENPQTLKISLGLSVIVRVTLRDGTFHEDIGYGHIENCKGKAAAFEKAKKEGTTDALKRALRNFGNVLGNCIYDKDYLSKVTKIKVGPTKFDEDNLHRHADFAKKEPIPVKVEPKAVADGISDLANASVISDVLALEDEFGDFDMADFGVTADGHPDEVVLPGSHANAPRPSDKPQNPIAGNTNDRSRPPVTGNPPRPMQPPSRPVAQPPRPPHTPNQQPQQRPSGQFQGRPNPQPQPPRPYNNNVGNMAQQAAANNKMMTPPPNFASRPPSGMNDPNGAPMETATFFSARSVKDVPESADPGTAVIVGAKIFDPRAESPSIRKTPGIDHNASKPLSRTGVHVQPVKRDPDQQRPTPGGPPNVINPSLSQMRQIGAPGAGSPLGNRGQYRPPTMKRPAPVGPDGGGNRTPLTEVSTNGPPAAAGATGVDAKRQKMT